MSMPLSTFERTLIEEAYPRLAWMFLGYHVESADDGRPTQYRRGMYVDYEADETRRERLDLHGVLVEALCDAARSWVANGYEGNFSGYAFNAINRQLAKATGYDSEAAKSEAGSLDANEDSDADHLPAWTKPHDTERLSQAPSGAPTEPDYTEALAGLIVAGLADGAVTERQAAALYRMTDLKGDGGAALTYEELGEALGIGRSSARKLYLRAVDGLREYVADRGLTWPE